MSPQVWTMNASQYQLLKGVHQPWIAEISPMQYAYLSKRGKSAYDAKRTREWDASTECKQDYANEVIEAFKSGSFALSDPDASEDAKRVIYNHMRDSAENARSAALQSALKENRILSASELAIGDRVFHLMYGRYVTVTKLLKVSARVKDASNKEFLVKAGMLQFWQYNDVNDRSDKGLPIRPIRQEVL